MHDKLVNKTKFYIQEQLTILRRLFQEMQRQIKELQEKVNQHDLTLQMANLNIN